MTPRSFPTPRRAWAHPALRTVAKRAHRAVGLALLAVVEIAPAAADSHCDSQAGAALIADCETLMGLKDQFDPDGVLNWARSPNC